MSMLASAMKAGDIGTRLSIVWYRVKRLLIVAFDLFVGRAWPTCLQLQEKTFYAGASRKPDVSARGRDIFSASASRTPLGAMSDSEADDGEMYADIAHMVQAHRYPKEFSAALFSVVRTAGMRKVRTHHVLREALKRATQVTHNADLTMGRIQSLAVRVKPPKPVPVVPGVFGTDEQNRTAADRAKAINDEALAAWDEAPMVLVRPLMTNLAAHDGAAADREAAVDALVEDIVREVPAGPDGEDPDWKWGEPQDPTEAHTLTTSGQFTDYIRQILMLSCAGNNQRLATVVAGYDAWRQEKKTKQAARDKEERESAKPTPQFTAEQLEAKVVQASRCVGMEIPLYNVVRTSDLTKLHDSVKNNTLSVDHKLHPDGMLPYKEPFGTAPIVYQTHWRQSKETADSSTGVSYVEEQTVGRVKPPTTMGHAYANTLRWVYSCLVVSGAEDMRNKKRERFLEPLPMLMWLEGVLLISRLQDLPVHRFVALRDTMVRDVCEFVNRVSAAALRQCTLHITLGNKRVADTTRAGCCDRTQRQR